MHQAAICMLHAVRTELSLPAGPACCAGTTCAWSIRAGTSYVALNVNYTGLAAGDFLVSGAIRGRSGGGADACMIRGRQRLPQDCMHGPAVGRMPAASMPANACCPASATAECKS